MKDYKNNSFTKCLMMFTVAVYCFLPPVLTTYFFEFFNLNPFAIIKCWHFNPFSADRGIPSYQTFLYLLLLWAVLNLALWLCLWAAARIYARWVAPHR
ncbi:Uncharacterised protein [Serratia entomophila]|jgi:hypothetical protein|uniref:Uncharacterized protein n=1 Tax=Serratia entomophila TaxID=42906 RepID=A0ABY5CLE4_9GAMM|nr:hypothetical protein [Serratia entomophila]UIW16464.1 hypothetical protein KHA73_13520 [Serratia entomophila]USU99021.1 hypothetical protein KFQ06_13185 [Serratia entomophila]CAI0772251.1 Uncharacterised protein [Serratia entomophila]CAI0772483.1 Uncharacterised protein [Serratia entomophila]CAI0772872.1 Uncharacterised protein [Serratia entomophila]